MKRTLPSSEQSAKVFKALSEPRRVTIIDALLKNGPQCGSQLASELTMSIALLCHHCEVLVDATLIRKERVGQRRVFSLDAAALDAALRRWQQA